MSQHIGPSATLARLLVARGVLSERAARFLRQFAGTQVFCEVMQMPNGEVGVIYRERWWTPAEFNALAADHYPPTPEEVGAAICAFAALAATTPTPEPRQPAPECAPQSAPTPDEIVARLRAEASSASPDDAPPAPEPAPRPAPGSPAADAELEALHQAASPRPGGAGALAWGLAALLFWLALAVALLGFWRVVQLFWPR